MAPCGVAGASSLGLTCTTGWLHAERGWLWLMHSSIALRAKGCLGPSIVAALLSMAPAFLMSSPKSRSFGPTVWDHRTAVRAQPGEEQ